MQEISISDAITVGPAPETIETFELMKLNGFRTVVNLSAKGELGEVLKPYDASVMAEDAGLAYVHFPVSMSSMKFDHVDAFVDTIAANPGSVYVHCRIGQRSGPFALMWHALREGLSTAETLTLASRLGLRWRAEMITDFISGYLDRHRAASLAMAA